MKKFLSPGILLLALLSCNKDHSNAHCTDNALIKQIKSGEITQQQFTYNGNCQVFESVESFRYTKYTYENARLIKEEQALTLDPLSCFMPAGSDATVTDPRKAKISYYNILQYDSSGKLKTKSRYFVSSSSQLISVNRYEYSGNRISRQNILNPDNELGQYDVYQYDESGNLLRDDSYMVSPGNEGIIYRTTTYEFDDKINPFNIFSGSGEPGLYTNKNNVTKLTTIYHEAGNEYQNIVEYLIEYSPSGYPVKVNDLAYIYGN